MLRNISIRFLLALALGFVGLGLISKTLTAIAQDTTAIQQEEKEPLAKGKWKVITVPDYRQQNDFSVPVEVTRITSALREGDNSRLVELIIKNRTTRNITALKVRYFLTTEEDFNTVLFQGPSLDIVSRRAKEERPTLPAGQKRIFEIKDGKISKLLKPIVKNGALYGNFVITLKMEEVTFEDGSTWRE